MWFELKLLIRYAWVIDPATGLNTMTNLLIEDGKIVKVGGGPMQADQVIDAAGLVAAPGLVDMHVHLREPGFAYKETVATGCAAAARGGVTTLVAMANTKPVTDSPELVRLVVEKAARHRRDCPARGRRDKGPGRGGADRLCRFEAGGRSGPVRRRGAHPG